MAIFFRILIAGACFSLGFLFFPMFIISALIAWSVISDIADAPSERARRAEIAVRVNAPVTVEKVHRGCESPAETAFLDAMVSAHSLETGNGAIEGNGLRLRNQVGMGDLRLQGRGVYYQYRADFLVDEKLVVEIDGAAYHSSAEDVARDNTRDADLRRAGFSVLRISAKVVFQRPHEAVRAVDRALETLRNGGSLHEPAVKEAGAVTPKPISLIEAASTFGRKITSALDELDSAARKMHDQTIIDRHSPSGVLANVKIA